MKTNEPRMNTDLHGWIHPCFIRADLWLISCVLVCSCQSLPRDTATTKTSTAGAPPAFASRPPQVAPIAPAQRPVVQQVGHQHAACASGHCPCCGPGTLPAFAFTGPAIDE